jgi:GNAT superfamily N-acetyltransferase
VSIARVDWVDPRAEILREAMDIEMTALYADAWVNATDEENELVHQALSVDGSEIITSVLASIDNEVAGHLAVRPFSEGLPVEALEVKKVFVSPQFRGRGISIRLMHEAELIARERGIKFLVLQTGDRQAEAIALYLRCGYIPIPVYGPYVVMSNALCFGKRLL